MSYYQESPFERIVDVHWKKKDNGDNGHHAPPLPCYPFWQGVGEYNRWYLSPDGFTWINPIQSPPRIPNYFYQTDGTPFPDTTILEPIYYERAVGVNINTGAPELFVAAIANGMTPVTIRGIGMTFSMDVFYSTCISRFTTGGIYPPWGPDIHLSYTEIFTIDPKIKVAGRDEFCGTSIVTGVVTGVPPLFMALYHACQG